MDWSLRFRSGRLRVAMTGVFCGGILALAPGVCGQAQEAPSVNLQYPNNPLSDILRIYEELTGKKIIKDVNVIGATVSVETTGMLTREAAVEFIEKTLLLNGYAFVPSGADTLKIIAFSGKQPRSEGVPIYSRVEDLPETDLVVSYFLPLTYITTEEAVQTFTQVIPSHAYGVVVPVPNASAVIVTENSAVIRSLVDLAEYVDVPPAQVLNKSIQLERSDAEEVASILNELLGAQSESRGRSTTTAARVLPAQVRAQVGGVAGQPGAVQASLAAAGGAGTTSESIQPQIVPITRTNRLLVIARPIDMAYIESLVSEFDAPAEIRNFLKRKLNYLRVTDFLVIASDALSRGQEEGQGIGGAGPLGRTTTTQTARQTAAQTGRQTGGVFGGGGGFGEGVTVADPEQLGGPESLLVGKTLLIADPQANSLIVSGPPENLRIVDELLDELDVRSSQIYLSTIIGQMTLADNLNWDLAILKFLTDNADGGAAASFKTRSANPVIIDPEMLTNVAAFATAPTGFSVFSQIGGLNMFGQVLATNNEFQMLSRPSVFVRNNSKATIRSGTRQPVPTSTLTNVTGATTSSVSSAIDFVDIVLELEVVALINSEDEVTLQIAQVNDNTTGSVTISGNPIPIISTQELLTEVTVPNKSIVALGGLVSDTGNDNKTGVPFLIRVPILKHLFGGTVSNTTRNELLIFMQPHIIDSAADLVDANVDLTRRTAVAPDALEYGLPEAPVLPTEMRDDVAVERANLNEAWENELARRRQLEAEATAEKKAGRWGGLFRKREKKATTVGPGR